MKLYLKTRQIQNNIISKYFPFSTQPFSETKDEILQDLLLVREKHKRKEGKARVAMSNNFTSGRHRYRLTFHISSCSKPTSLAQDNMVGMETK